MANTTNFNWETPDDTDLVKDGAAAIRTLGSAIDTSLVDLKGGTTGQVLSKATNTDMDFTWVAQDDSNAIQNALLTTTGDTIYASSASTPARLGIGTTGQVLTVAGGIPSWATPVSTPTFVGCSLKKSANQSIANNTGTAITFDQENFDTDGFHSTSTNTSRITIPSGKAGYYLITGTLSYAANSTGGRWCFVKKNGAAYIGPWSMQAPTASGQWAAGAISHIGNFAQGDYIELFAEHTAGTSLNVNGGSEEGTVLQVQFLGA